MLFLTSIIAFLLVVLGIKLYLKLSNSFEYWKRKGVSYLKPSIPFGNITEVTLGKKHTALVFQYAYNHFFNKRYFGFYEFSTPILVLRDLNLIKQICSNDFDKFTDHTEFLPEYADPFWNKTLFARKGADWHRMRSIVSPAFTSSKMKSMFHLITESAEEFVDHFSKHPGTITLELRDAFTRFTNDVIASCAFGIKCDSLNNKDNEFFVMSKNAFDFSGFKSLLFFGASLSPGLMNLLKISLFDEKMKNFFRTIVRESIEHRERTGIIRPDMIHLLREAQKGLLKNESNADSNLIDPEDNTQGEFHKTPLEITNEDIVVQSVGFIFGGFDTVSVLLSQMAYELAVNFEVQEKLVQEIDETLSTCNGKITYTALMEMKYLDMVVSETLRLWPPIPMLNRKCVQTYTIEPDSPDETPLHLSVGDDCLIPVYAIQRDPQYFSNPDKFDPERFSSENKDKIQAGSFIPFGLGPRFCIGNRFALMEGKAFIVFLLAQFNIVPVEKTKIPIVLKNDFIGFNSKDGYWFGLKPRMK